MSNLMTPVLRDLLRAMSKDPRHLEVAIDALVVRAKNDPDLRIEHVLALLRPAVDEPGQLEAVMDSLIGHAEEDPGLLRALVAALSAGTRSAAARATPGNRA